MRFYDVNGGSIQADGTDIRHITRKSLRRNYGMVLQETWLKSGTIRSNIVMGKPDATDEEVIAAARASHAHSFIKRLPNGYDTVIGEDGGSLSQGQKQLLCITRVMLCLPPMLILDEATSSIDTRTEIKIQEAFARLMQGRTSFIVAHRLSTIHEADIILVMRDGHIIERAITKSFSQRTDFTQSCTTASLQYNMPNRPVRKFPTGRFLCYDDHFLLYLKSQISAPSAIVPVLTSFMPIMSASTKSIRQRYFASSEQPSSLHILHIPH